MRACVCVRACVSLTITESQFADDSSLLTKSSGGRAEALSFVDNTAGFRFTVNALKITLLVICIDVTTVGCTQMNLGRVDIKRVQTSLNAIWYPC